MKRAKISLLLACGVFLSLPVCGRAQAGSPTAAAAAPTDSITVDQILTREVLASGGKDAWMRITSMHMKGSLEVSGPAQNAVTGTFESYDIAPNKSLQTVMIGQSIAMRRGFDGVNGWKYQPGRGTEDLVGDELEDTKLDADFYELIKLKELFPQMVLQGEASVDGRHAYAIVGTPVRGAPRTLYFDKDSGLLIGMSQTIATGDKTSHTDSFFDDFRAVNGIQVPYTIRTKADAITLVIHLQSVQANLIIMDSGFSKPTALPRAPAPAPVNPSPSATHPATGSLDGHTFTSTTFGFSYTYPAGWTVHGDATNRELLDIGSRVIAGQDAARRAAIASAVQRSSVLLNAFQYPLGTPGVANQNIIVVAERVDFAPGIRTGGDYLLNIKPALQQMTIRHDLGDISEFTVSGHQFYRLDVVLHRSAKFVYQAYVSTKLGTHILSFCFSGNSREELESLVGTLDSLKFN